MSDKTRPPGQGLNQKLKCSGITKKNKSITLLTVHSTASY